MGEIASGEVAKLATMGRKSVTDATNQKLLQ